MSKLAEPLHVTSDMEPWLSLINSLRHFTDASMP